MRKSAATQLERAASNISFYGFIRQRAVSICLCCSCCADMSSLANLTAISTPLPAAVAVAAFPTFIPPAAWPSLPPSMSPEPPSSPSWSASDWPPLTHGRDDDGPFRSDHLRPKQHMLRSVAVKCSHAVASALSVLGGALSSICVVFLDVS